ncbi:MAG TPA: universal stress protein [Acidobacteriaceae bacterium]|nr:universal stress protein [Acidobacteriaceae bacterium]
MAKLLVAIDFSQQTPRTLEAAVTIAKAFGSELILVNGATPQVYGTGVEPVPIETFEVALDIAKGMMTELVDNCGDLTTIKHREIVTYCYPADLIEQIVKDEKVDLVVAGSHGPAGMERLALGSIAQSILQRIPCPTLIVGPHCTAVHHPFRSILLATDLERTGLRAAQYASGLAERFHGKLTLLHVVEPKSMPDERRPVLAEEEILRSLRSLLPSDLAIYSSGELRIEHGKAGQMITQVAQSVCPSLLVMGIREGAMLSDHAPWSTLAHVIREARCPVLVVRRRLQ